MKAIAVESGETASLVSTATYTFSSSANTTSTSLQSSANPSVLNQPVTFTATVRAASGATPTGPVIFQHGSVQIGSASLVNGVAQLTVSNLTAERHSITATYTGSSTNSASSSPELFQVVNSQ